MPIDPKFVARRMIETREALGWSQAELARRSGLSQPTVWALENAQTKEVKAATLQKVSAATGRPMSHFTGIKEGNTVADVNVRYTRVPIISWVRAGQKNPVTDPFLPGASDEWEDATVPASKETFALRVRGDSMVAPDGTGFPEGAIIIVDPAVEARNGDYVVVRFQDSDEATFKRLVVDGPNKLLKALNPAYPTITVSEDARLAGVVIEVNLRRKFR